LREFRVDTPERDLIQRHSITWSDFPTHLRPDGSSPAGSIYAGTAARAISKSTGTWIQPKCIRTLFYGCPFFRAIPVPRELEGSSRIQQATSN